MPEKWSLGYWTLKQYVKFAYWIFHRKIIIRGKKNIPLNKPVIYAPNHPNALNDDLCMTYASPHQTVWLGRASLFKSAVVRPFLRFLKIIPVYRIRDGKELLKGNDQSFAAAVNVLKHNRALGIYPEAAHSLNRQMLPHKKAIPRIVFLAGEMTDFSIDIRIVPVGIYYDQNQNFGRRFLIGFGEPVAAKNYYEAYRQNPYKATMALRNDLYHAILPLTLNFETKTNLEGFEAIRIISGKVTLMKKGLADSMPNRLKTDQELIGMLDIMERNDPDKAGKLAERALAFLDRMKSLGLRSWLVDKKEEKPGKLLLHLLILVFSLPLFAYGSLFNIIPFVVLDRIIKQKVKDPIWISTFTFGLGIVVFPLFYLIGLLLFSPLLPGWYTRLFFLVTLPLAGKSAFLWYILFLKTLGRFRWLRIKRSKPELYNEIHLEKQEISEQIGE